MEKYFRRLTENRHFKGFIAGVVSSTIAFGLMSSVLVYRLTQATRKYDDDYEFDYRGYDDNDKNTYASHHHYNENRPFVGRDRKTEETQTENVILRVSEQDEPVKVDSSVKEVAAWPTFREAREPGYYP
jgi:hypothetical protein